MAIASPTLVTSSKKGYKFEEDYPQKPYKTNARSLIAFLSSILFYTSIFYIFNLSPSTLFYNTKFWFVISNTLILIIAADYSSSKDKHDQLSYQEEYMLRRQPQTTPSSFVQEYPSQIEFPFSNHHDQVVAHQNIEALENKPTKDVHDENHSDEVDVHTKRIVHVQPKARKRKNDQAKLYKRSKSEEVRRVTNVDACKTITRSETMETHEASNAFEEENEYATMSNEELNRRSEEFIRRFNEQIRRQSVEDRRLRLVYYDHECSFSSEQRC